MEVLSFLLPRNTNEIDIPLITIDKTIRIINNMTSSNATGHDPISSKILKKIKKEIAPHITHLTLFLPVFFC